MQIFKDKHLLILLIGIFLVSLMLLMSGLTVLSYRFIPGVGLPLGNILAALVLFLLAEISQQSFRILIKHGSKFLKYLVGINKLAAYLSLLWIPVSYLLAGNFAANFGPSEDFQGGVMAGSVMFFYTLFIVAITLVSWFLFLVYLLIKLFKKLNYS